MKAAELAARQAFEARQKMLLEEQKASADAASAGYYSTIMTTSAHTLVYRF